MCLDLIVDVDQVFECMVEDGISLASIGGTFEVILILRVILRDVIEFTVVEVHRQYTPRNDNIQYKSRTVQVNK